MRLRSTTKHYQSLPLFPDEFEKFAKFEKLDFDESESVLELEMN